MKRMLRAAGILGLTMFLGASNREAKGQAAIAVQKLDFNRFTGSWYEIARFANKREKNCTGDVVEVIALGDKSKQLQIVTSCKTSKGYTDVRNATAKAKDKADDGTLKVTYIWPFSEKDWVLDVGLNYEWLLVGSPNHKALWVFSRSRLLAPEALAHIEQQATAEGFSSAKLVTTSQSGQ